MSKHDAYQQFSFVTAEDVFGAMMPKQTELNDDDLLWAKEQPNLSRIIRSVANELQDHEQIELPIIGKQTQTKSQTLVIAQKSPNMTVKDIAKESEKEFHYCFGLNKKRRRLDKDEIFMNSVINQGVAKLTDYDFEVYEAQR